MIDKEKWFREMSREGISIGVLTPEPLDYWALPRNLGEESGDVLLIRISRVNEEKILLAIGDCRGVVDPSEPPNILAKLCFVTTVDKELLHNPNQRVQWAEKAEQDLIGNLEGEYEKGELKSEIVKTLQRIADDDRVDELDWKVTIGQGNYF